jgi:D-serine deaminase-like pyridoxal phosphate-dependent protein
MRCYKTRDAHKITIWIVRRASWDTAVPHTMATVKPDAGTFASATPALVVDESILDANIVRVAEFTARAGLALRPHVKTHKSIEIARRQIAAGAVGITVATVSEAEIFARAGFDDILIAYPVWIDESKTSALQHVLELSSVILGVDSVDGARQIAGVDRAEAGRLSVLVEVDSGHHRSGVQPPDAGTLAASAQDAGLDVAGVFTFPGHSYSPQTRESAARDEQEALSIAAASLADHGIQPRIVSGGSTPSLEFAGSSVLTEVRPGVYVFGDAQQWELGATSPASIALTVLATVVSRSPGRIILDSGSKVLGADRGAYSTGFGRLLDYPDARIPALSEHHATVVGVDLPLGTHVRVAPNHVCAAVNLADEYVVAGRDGGLASWPVDARGRNR